jgi:hypothetical protein
MGLPCPAKIPRNPFSVQRHAAILEALQVRHLNFIDELRAVKPTLEEEQRAGAPCCGTSASTAKLQEEWREARVPQQPYVYQTKV